MGISSASKDSWINARGYTEKVARAGFGRQG